jgi:hypothetical protein
VKRLVARFVRALFELLPDSMRRRIMNRRAEMAGIGQVKMNQELLALHLAELEHRENPVQPADDVEDDRFPPLVRSRLCTEAQVRQPWFKRWCEAIGEQPTLHRKSWEFAYVAEVLDQLDLLGPGRRGLGFGVGREALVAGFASRGVEVVATDLAPSSREALGWARSGQHAFGLEGLLRPEVCDPETFRKLVSWRDVDMRSIPDDLTGFDFCWSICSFEHLGSLTSGMDFVERSLATLAPGGIAVHTTEFNLSSDEDTIEDGPVVIYRKRDLLGLKERLEGEGHQVAAFDFDPGKGLLDKFVDLPPFAWADEPTLRFLHGPYTLTSIAIVVRARPS